MVDFVETMEFLENMPALYFGELLQREDIGETTSEEKVIYMYGGMVFFFF